MNKLNGFLSRLICCWNYQAYGSRAREEEHSKFTIPFNKLQGGRRERGEEEKNNAGKIQMKKDRKHSLLARGAKWPSKEMDKERQAVYVEFKARSWRQADTHLRPAGSNKLPTHRGSKWVCVSIEEGKQKAEGIRSERRENGHVNTGLL